MVFLFYRVVWSSSPDATCQLLDKLKQNRPDPDIKEIERRTERATDDLTDWKTVDICRCAIPLVYLACLIIVVLDMCLEICPEKQQSFAGSCQKL